MSSNWKSLKSSLENYYKDAVDIEFVVQDGKFWVLNTRPMRRSNAANLKIVTDLFLEKKIESNDVIQKIRLQDIQDATKPVISNINDLKFLAKGLPASSGSSSGNIYFFSDDIIKNSEKNCILFRIEVSPEDLDGIHHSQGIVTSRGGMTSHAAIVSRNLGKSCITGLSSLKIDYRKRTANIGSYKLKEGDWVTINASEGILYFGKGSFNIFDWKMDNKLLLLYKIIEQAIYTNTILDSNIGKAWAIRDYFIHNNPLTSQATKKKNVEKSFIYQNNSQNIRDKKNVFSNLINISSDDNIKMILLTMRNSLLRQLSNKAGIGQHYKYYRPLINPMHYVKKKYTKDGNIILSQLVSEEFYNISKFIPNLIDIYQIKIHMEFEVNSENKLSFLDYTNPKGESLVMMNDNIVKYSLEINEQKIDNEKLPRLYNNLRKREYYWNWYNENLTSYDEIVSFLKGNDIERIKNYRLNVYAHELELLENNNLTKSGKGLLNENWKQNFKQ